MCVTGEGAESETKQKEKKMRDVATIMNLGVFQGNDTITAAVAEEWPPKHVCTQNL